MATTEKDVAAELRTMRDAVAECARALLNDGLPSDKLGSWRLGMAQGYLQSARDALSSAAFWTDKCHEVQS